MELSGALVRDVARQPVGRVHGVLLDPATLDARWLDVTLDDGSGNVLVPAAAASENESGELLVPYPASTIGSATRPEGAVLTETEAATLRAHYGFPA